MKGTQEKERLRLRDDGNYEFSTAEKNWIPAIRNVPEIDGMVPAGGKRTEKGQETFRNGSYGGGNAELWSGGLCAGDADGGVPAEDTQFYRAG